MIFFKAFFAACGVLLALGLACLLYYAGLAALILALVAR
jgi:hypothetical protein